MFEEVSEPQFDVFSGLLFNALKGFAYMVFIAFAMIAPTDKTGEIDTDAEILVAVSWRDGLEDDIDTCVEHPAGNVLWFNAREGGLMHLDRDDRGQFKDVVLIGDRELENPLNQETVSVRGLMDGEYIVNVVHFIAVSTEPVPVTVRVEKLNPTVQIVCYGDVTLPGDEATVVRFPIEGDGFSDVNDRPKSLVDATRGGGGAALSGNVDPGTGEQIGP